MNELGDLADGDLTVTATVSEDITGAIADSINYTIEELRVLVGRINDAASRVTTGHRNGAADLHRVARRCRASGRRNQSAGQSVLSMVKLDDQRFRRRQAVGHRRPAVPGGSRQGHARRSKTRSRA
jgi:twitching motility protein PilJ